MTFTGNMVSVSSLKVHPKNEEYFSSLTPEKYEEVKRSIEAHGIRDPLKVLPDYTVIAGHQRLKIASELGLDKVPVIILELSPEEAEYLLIADNEERRQDDNDPMRKARRAQFLKEYWNVKRGGNRGNRYTGKISVIAKDKNCPLLDTEIPKTLQQIAESFGESKQTLKNLLKLNDLIPPLQELVSRQRLSRVAAYSLAFLAPEDQEDLLKTLGESGICDLSVTEAKTLRQELERERQKANGLHVQLLKLEEEKCSLLRQASETEENIESRAKDIARAVSAQHEEKLQQATSALKADIEALQLRLRQAQGELKTAKAQEAYIDRLKSKIADMESQVKSADGFVLEKLKAETEALKKQKAELEMGITRARNGIAFVNYAKDLFKVLEKKEDDFNDLLRETEINGMLLFDAKRWLSLLRRYISRIEGAMGTISVEGTVIDVDVDVIDIETQPNGLPLNQD